MPPKQTHQVINWLVALVWAFMGLYCKVLGFVPRHQQIVASILGDEYSLYLTKTIGVSEILMAVWILTGIKSRLSAIFQAGIVVLMNILEFWLAPELLLFGKANILFAIAFSGLVLWNEFMLVKEKS